MREDISTSAFGSLRLQTAASWLTRTMVRRALTRRWQHEDRRFGSLIPVVLLHKLNFYLLLTSALRTCLLMHTYVRVIVVVLHSDSSVALLRDIIKLYK
jgi:hypothetical protein